MTSPQPLEVLDLRHFNARQLRPLLEEEARLWLRELRWEYTGATELLLQYLDSRILPGFVALERGRIRGFCFCVYEAQKAVIGDIFASGENLDPAGVVQLLSLHLLEMLLASPGVERIEAQLLLYPGGALRAAFAQPEFTVFPRLFLEREIRPQAATPAPFAAPLELVRWQPQFYQVAAELIHAAYAGHMDAQINDQYRSLHGSLRFLHNIVRFPGCGTFDPMSTWLVFDRTRASAVPVAAILCSRVAPGVAHITQLCVLPEYRGRGLGANLLRWCVGQLGAAGFRAATLTVTAANEPAYALYRDAGFSVRHRFDALVYDKPKHFGGPALLSRL